MKKITETGESNSFKLNYFFMYGSLGLAMPFFPIFLNNYGCDSKQIAFLQSLQPILLCFCPALIGHLISIGIFGRNTVLTYCAWGSFLSITPLFAGYSITLLTICLFLHAPFRVLMGPMVDAACLDFLKRSGEEYGRLRLYGSIGFIVTSLLGGTLFSWGPIIPFLTAYFVLQLGQVFVTRSLVVNHDTSCVIIEKQSNTKDEISAIFWTPVILFLIFSILHQISQGTYYIFYSLHLNQNLEISMDWIGLFWIVGVVSEILVMFYYQKIWGNIREEWIFILSALLNALRWWAVAHCSSILLMALLQTLHAFSFGTFQVASMRLLDRTFPRASKNFGVGLYVSLSYGLGGVLGMNGAGWLRQFYEIDELFAQSALIGAISVVPALIMLLKNSQVTAMTNRSA